MQWSTILKYHKHSRKAWSIPLYIIPIIYFMKSLKSLGTIDFGNKTAQMLLLMSKSAQQLSLPVVVKWHEGVIAMATEVFSSVWRGPSDTDELSLKSQTICLYWMCSFKSFPWLPVISITKESTANSQRTLFSFSAHCWWHMITAWFTAKGNKTGYKSSLHWLKSFYIYSERRKWTGKSKNTSGFEMAVFDHFPFVGRTFCTLESNYFGMDSRSLFCTHRP